MKFVNISNHIGGNIEDNIGDNIEDNIGDNVGDIGVLSAGEGEEGREGVGSHH